MFRHVSVSKMWRMDLKNWKHWLVMLRIFYTVLDIDQDYEIRTYVLLEVNLIFNERCCEPSFKHKISKYVTESL